MYELNLACPNDMYYELNVHVLCGYLSTAGEHICTRFEGVLAACANGFDHRCRPIIVKISYLIHTYVYLIHTYTIPQHIQLMNSHIHVCIKTQASHSAEKQ